MTPSHFREPGAAQAGGWVLAIACVLVVIGLIFHPVPSGGFEEKPSVLQNTPWWGAIHVAIAAGFALCVLGGLLMLFAGGVRPAHLLLPALAAVPLGAYVLIAESYRLKRLLAFMSPGADLLGVNFQLNQSLLAFGSGGLWGVGLGEGRQKMFYLPAAHTDFIFSVVGEELGLLGALVVLALFAVVAVRGFRIALRHGDRFASLLAFGVTLSLILQAAVNVGVVMGLLPTKGLTLPFVSYGGSAIIASLAQAGVLVALARETG